MRYRLVMTVLVLAAVALVGMKLVHRTRPARIVEDGGRTPDVAVAITNLRSDEAVGGETVPIHVAVDAPRGVTIRAVAVRIQEEGRADTAETLPATPVKAAGKTQHRALYQAGWNTMLLHNSRYQLAATVQYTRGTTTYTQESRAVTVAVKNLWITSATPSTAFFALPTGRSQVINVNFDHYQAHGRYTVEYTLRMTMANTDVLQTVTHRDVRTHHDALTVTADRENHPF
ncbi:MAG: hypothetical protein ACYDBB_23185 [Armatimonadota bacterium]